MKTLCLAALALMLASWLAAHPAYNGWEQLKLKGEVREYRVHGPDAVETYVFDREGCIISKTTVRMPAGPNVPDTSETIFLGYSYSRDGEGRITGLETVANDGVVATRETYVYDSDGVLTKSVSEYPEEGRVFEVAWDPSGRELSARSLDASGTLFNVFRYTWDERGLMVRKAILDAEKYLVEYTDYEYDDNGFVIRKTTYGPDDKAYEWVEYQNNERGDPVRLRFFESYDEHVVEDSISYLYDERGNITQKSGIASERFEYVYFR
jgi:uncharacterized protein YkuJ